MTRVGNAGELNALVAELCCAQAPGDLHVTIRIAARSSAITPFGTSLRY
jgi:hypothetical protein